MPNLTRHQRLNLARALENDRLKSPVALEVLDLIAGAPWYLYRWPIYIAEDRAEVIETARQKGVSRPGVVPFLLKRLGIAEYVEMVEEHDEEGDSWPVLALSEKALAIAAGEVEVPKRKKAILSRQVEREQIAEVEARVERLWRAWCAVPGAEPTTPAPPQPPPAPKAPRPPEDFSGLPDY
jgi:hypothetical protein